MSNPYKNKDKSIGIATEMYVIQAVNYAKWKQGRSYNKLAVAILNRNYKLITKLLLSKRINVNKQNRIGNTLLHLAVEVGTLQIVKQLLNHGADFKLKDNNGSDVFHTTAMLAGGNVMIMNGNQPGKGTLLKILDILIDQGADINTCNKTNNTALILNSHNEELVNFLISRKADVNKANKEGNTALILTSLDSHAKSIKKLIEAGADINHQNNKGLTALMLAAAIGNKEGVVALYEKGADVGITDADGDTAETIARANGKREILKLLELFKKRKTLLKKEKKYNGSIDTNIKLV